MAKGSTGNPVDVQEKLLNLADTLNGADDRTLTELRDLLNDLSIGQTNKNGASAHGQDTDDGTGSTLNGGTSLTIPENFGVRVKALTNNAGPVYVGASGVDDTTGFQLTPNSGVVLYVKDISSISIYAPNSGDGVSWIVEQSS